MKVRVLSNQTLADIAIQVYGGVEGVFILAKDNGLNVTDELMPGQMLYYTATEVLDKGIAKHYGVNGICPATLHRVNGGGVFGKSFDSTFS